MASLKQTIRQLEDTDELGEGTVIGRGHRLLIVGIVCEGCAGTLYLYGNCYYCYKEACGYYYSW